MDKDTMQLHLPPINFTNRDFDPILSRRQIYIAFTGFAFVRNFYSLTRSPSPQSPLFNTPSMPSKTQKAPPSKATLSPPDHLDDASTHRGSNLINATLSLRAQLLLHLLAFLLLQSHNSQELRFRAQKSNVLLLGKLFLYVLVAMQPCGRNFL